MDQRHHRHDDPHGDSARQHTQRAPEGNDAGCHHGTDGNAYRDDALQHCGPRQGHAQLHFSPLQDDELQRGACTPEQGRDCERYLAELVSPQRGQAMGEILEQCDRVA